MRRPGLSYANVMSTVAVVLAMSGTAVAATQISGSTIKDRTIAHKKLALNTVTGAEVRESTLGRVPSASSATNAGKLDGIDSTGFVKGSGVKVYQAKRAGLPNSGSTNVTLFTFAGLGRLDVVCNGQELSWMYTNTTSANEYGTALSGDDGTQTATVYVSNAQIGTTAGSNYFTYFHNNAGILPGTFHDEIDVVSRNAAQTTAHIRLSGVTGAADTCNVTAEATVF